MIRRFLTVVFATAALLLRAQDPVLTRPDLSADTGEIDANEQVFRGHAILREGPLLVTADTVRYMAKTEVIIATGNVVYTRGPFRLLADEVILNRRDRTFTAEHVRLGSYPYFIRGESAHGGREDVTVYKAQVSYGEPGPWQPTLRANEITVTFSGRVVQHISTAGAQVGIGHLQPVPFPKFRQSVSDPLLSGIRLTGGYRGSLGAFVDGGLQLPVAPGLRLGGDVGVYTARGILAGPAGTYSNPNDPDQLRGLFHSGYINDHGDKGVDILDRRVPEDRAFIAWQHQQTLGDVSLNAELNWWKDSEVVRDFRPRAFFPVQQPDTFLEATYTNANSFVSVFTRLAPNDFEVVQQRVPELRFDLLPLAVGNGWYEQFHASIATLHERPVVPRIGATPAPFAEPSARDLASWTTTSPYLTGTPFELRTTRMDAYYGLSRPIAPRDWFTLTPVAGGRITHYMNSRGAAQNGRYTRVLGELGADAELRTSGTFAYQNPAWKIDGLRHLFTPAVSYRYIPEGEQGRAHIPAIDREVFSTYLQPLGLGERRNVDDLRSTNTLRLALNNTLQTRDAQEGSRDLLVFNVANDFRFRRRPGQRDVSEIHTDIAALPAKWLEIGAYNSFSPQNFTLREFNTGITLRDGNVWAVRFANNFLRHQLEDYLVDGRARVNEQFDVLAQLRYDQRKHRFTEQSYGVVQNLANTWRISYLVSFYSGRQRESNFGFSVQIDTVRF